MTKNPTPANLLGDWRAAERDTVAARTAQSVADLALESAHAAEEAAKETENAAQAAQTAAQNAQYAATRAKQAASHASEAATILSAGAEGDKIRANHAVHAAEVVEDKARERFHDAERAFKEGT